MSCRDWRSNGNWANLSAAGVHYVISLLWHSVISMNSLCIVYKLLYLLFLYCYNCLLLTWRTMCALQSFQSTYANMERANQSFTHAMNATYRISTLPQVYNITPCIHANASFSNLLLFSYNFCIFYNFCNLHTFRKTVLSWIHFSVAHNAAIKHFQFQDGHYRLSKFWHSTFKLS